MYKTNNYKVKIADTVLNNEVYKEIGEQLGELNRQFTEIGERCETYRDIRDFIRNKVLMTDNAPKRIEIYAVLFNSLAQSITSFEDSFNKSTCETIEEDATNMENVD
jgi:hypothetical protein